MESCSDGVRVYDGARGEVYDASSVDVWASIARSYSAFASPLVPCGEDIVVTESALVAHADGRRTTAALILGVTPALALMKWPNGTTIIAVDSCADVIRALWPGDIPKRRKAICANWLSIPRRPKSFDAVVGDGSLIACRFPDEARQLLRKVHDVLVEDGLFVLRVYIQSTRRESVRQVMDDLRGVEVPRVDIFKLRLWLSIQRSVAEGVEVRAAARTLEEHGISSQFMRERLGWGTGTIEPFMKWHRSDAVYTFPTLEEFRSLSGECFDEISISYPKYELGHCCPTFVMRAK